MSHQVLRDEAIHELIRQWRIPRPPSIVEQVATGRPIRPAPEVGHGTLWDRIPVHEFLERATSARCLPSRLYAEDIEPSGATERYRQLAFLQPPRGDEAAAKLVKNAQAYPRDRRGVKAEVRELWFAKRSLLRGEFVGIMDGSWSADMQVLRDRVVDVVSGFLVPNHDGENPHYVADQLWLIKERDSLRRVILEVRRDGFEHPGNVARREQMEALGYDVVVVARAWAAVDPLRALCVFADRFLGTTLGARLLCPPESLDQYVCGICGGVFARREPLDVVRYAEEDVTSAHPLRDARGFAHLACANSEPFADAAE